MTETPRKSPTSVTPLLMQLFTNNLNKEFTTDGVAAQSGANPESINTALRRFRANGWDVIRTGRGRFLCRSVGSYVLEPGSEQLPFIPKSTALKEVAPPAPPTPAADSHGINVGDLLEVSHVTRQGVMVAMDATGNAYKVTPL